MSVDQITDAIIQNRLDYGTYTLRLARAEGESRAYDVMQKIIDKNGNLLLHWFRCSRCGLLVYCNVGYSTNRLLRHVDIGCPEVPEDVRAHARAIAAEKRRDARLRQREGQQEQQPQFQEVFVPGGPDESKEQLRLRLQHQHQQQQQQQQQQPPNQVPLTIPELSEHYSQLLTIGALYGNTISSTIVEEILRRPHNWDIEIILNDIKKEVAKKSGIKLPAVELQRMTHQQIQRQLQGSQQIGSHLPITAPLPAPTPEPMQQGEQEQRERIDPSNLNNGSLVAPVNTNAPCNVGANASSSSLPQEIGSLLPITAQLPAPTSEPMQQDEQEQRVQIDPSNLNNGSLVAPVITNTPCNVSQPIPSPVQASSTSMSGINQAYASSSLSQQNGLQQEQEQQHREEEEEQQQPPKKKQRVLRVVTPSTRVLRKRKESNK